MNGVEILSSEIIYQTDVFWWLIPLCGGIGLFVGLLVCTAESIFNGDSILYIVALVVSCALVGFVLAVITEHDTDTVDYTQYKVTIDDSVAMNDFLDKYEILDQDGKIYIVKERE